MRKGFYFLSVLLFLSFFSCAEKFSTPILYEAIVLSTTDGDAIIENGENSASFKITGRGLRDVNEISICLVNNTSCKSMYPNPTNSDSLFSSVTSYPFSSGTSYIIYAVRTDSGDSSIKKYSNTILLRVN